MKKLVYNIIVFFEKDVNKVLSLGVVMIFIGVICIADSYSPPIRDMSGNKIQESENYRVIQKRGDKTVAEYVGSGYKILKREKSHLFTWGVLASFVGVVILIGVFIYSKRNLTKDIY